MPDASLTPGEYLRSCRKAAGLAIADVAAKLATEPRWAEHVRIEQLELIEANIQPANFATIVALSLAYPIEFGKLVALTNAPAQLASTPDLPPPPADATWSRLNQLPIADQRDIVMWLRGAIGDHRALGYWTGRYWAHAPIAPDAQPLPFRPYEFWRPEA